MAVETNDGKWKPLTFGDDPLQPDDVRVIELAHDARLAQKIAPLLLRVPRFQTLDGHVDLSLAWQLQTSATHLAKFPFGEECKVLVLVIGREGKRVQWDWATVAWADSDFTWDPSAVDLTLHPGETGALHRTSVRRQLCLYDIDCWQNCT